MNAEEFIARWSRSSLKERAAAQTHFNDLCELLGVEPPVEADPEGEWFVFERKTRRGLNARGFADVWRRNRFAWEYKGPDENLDQALQQLREYLPALENPPLLVVSDTRKIRIVTNFNNAIQEDHEYQLEDLREPRVLEQLRFVFDDPERLRPNDTPASVTEDAAENFALIVQSLREDGFPAPDAAHFGTQLLFCLFAEDIGILPLGVFRGILDTAQRQPDVFVSRTTELFERMGTGGWWAHWPIAHFNGRLFEDAPALPLNPTAFRHLLDVSKLTWSEIEPAIFGTLFERGMNPDKADIGRHYTDAEKIKKIINPVIRDPLRREWEQALQRIDAQLATRERSSNQAVKARALTRAQNLYERFIGRLADVRVLDPACGSGNFLYMALHTLKTLEHEAGIDAERRGLDRIRVSAVDPRSLLGIEIDEYAAELARVTIWIGELQWRVKNGYGPPTEPILRPLDNIQCRDALLNPDGSEATWPEAEFILGNPPFLGNKMMIGKLGEAKTLRLRERYAGRVPGGADLVTFWFAKALDAIRQGTARYAGLVATNSIRGGANREVLAAIREHGTIYNAWSDEEWAVEGAAVRVSLVCFSGIATLAERNSVLNGILVSQIYSDLTSNGATLITPDLTKAHPLVTNQRACFMGTTKSGRFDVDGTTARAWLLEPSNPNERPNSDVLRPWRNAMDITRRPADRWIIDFGAKSKHSEAALYSSPYEYVKQHVQPLRAKVRREAYRKYWWRLAEPRPGLMRAITRLDRFIATPSVAKHRVFVWVAAGVVPDHQLFIIARDDDTTFGILHSRFHEQWSLRLGTSLEDRPRYTPTTTFETFPFPEGLTPDVPARDYADDPRAEAIAAAARRLVEKRDNWLNPPDLVERVPEVVPGYPERIGPVDEEAAGKLKKRTLTHLYNERPTWLDHAHRELDAAVAEAYGWPADISDEEALARLLALNRERAAKQ